jgi:hypothetical protein
MCYYHIIMYYHHIFNTERNLNYVGPFSESKTTGRIKCPRKKGPDFWNGMVVKTEKVSATRSNCSPTVLLTRMYLRMPLCYFRNLFLKLVKLDPFRQTISISSIYNKIFRTCILKADTVGDHTPTLFSKGG